MGIVIMLAVAVVLFFGVQLLARGNKQTLNVKAYTALAVTTIIVLSVVIFSGALQSDSIGITGSLIALVILTILMQPVFVQLQRKIEAQREKTKDELSPPQNG
ncbi:hypothetical protein H2C43_13055 [Corynebacterium glutamicum]|uniref:Uncharacterized protein n=4 Tax=Corynebacterium TaxID=1716 RepID=A0A0F6WQL2_9CORY|nr:MULTISPECIES: hypothetical protein [Corynebacterium]AGN19087.1 hypothetical protein C624_07550 [Corynebacterium glutamicum SCgG1]AGN22112.1 hypothetical protein C629_07560 [Corynebacterium glutamicum SCgG2]AIK85028.1 hypothetical protein CGLAR1_07125 [Corynebacterium glutamicum]AIK87812.1 hypothetical protein AR0_07260 [Corynebacterium glutamicum]AJE67303.1 hypothetical protein SB89_06965 [Corynebacterium glutamicum]